MEMFSSGYKRLSGVIKTTDWSLQENTSEVIFIAEAVGALSVWAHRHDSSTCQPDLHLSVPALLCLSFPLATPATLTECSVGLAFWEMNTAIPSSTPTALTKDSQNLVYKYSTPIR